MSQWRYRGNRYVEAILAAVEGTDQRRGWRRVVDRGSRRRAQAELIVIGALAGRAEMAGWDLLQTTRLSPGRLYVALERLQGTGRITAAEDPDLRGEPQRRMYRLSVFYRLVGGSGD